MITVFINQFNNFYILLFHYSKPWPYYNPRSDLTRWKRQLDCENSNIKQGQVLIFWNNAFLGLILSSTMILCFFQVKTLVFFINAISFHPLCLAEWPQKIIHNGDNIWKMVAKYIYGDFGNSKAECEEISEFF